MRLGQGREGEPSRGGALASTLAALVVVAVIAGCGPEAEGDPQLTIYLSAPLSGPRAADGQDIADGAALALADVGGEAGGTAVVLESLDDATEMGWDAAAAGANARVAAQDSTAIAYIGELDSGASRTSILITNMAGILQVSPGSGAEDLTREEIGSSRFPDVQPSGARTFGRVIPSDRAQGEAAGVWISESELASVVVAGGDSEFGEALISGIEAVPSGPAVVTDATEAESVYVVEEVEAGSATEPLPEGTPDGRARPDAPEGVPVFGSDALLAGGGPPEMERSPGPSVAGASPTGSPTTLRLTSAALDPSQLPPQAGDFLLDFRDTYDRAPGRYAAYGYEAMAVVLDSIERAGDPLDRGAVTEAFFATEDRDSVLGTYSIDEVGDTTLARLGAYEVTGEGELRASPEPLTLP